jgi:AraC-like DNA-binding protein
MEIERLLDCPVRSNAAWTGLAVPRESWQLPLRRRDPILRRVLESQADALAPQTSSADSLALIVRGLLAPRLARGETDIALVARELGLSARTLQRRLAEAGSSFQAILDAVRKETVAKCLADRSLSLGEIAYIAGYSEPAAFHRAFKRWYGMPPDRFRQQEEKERSARL